MLCLWNKYETACDWLMSTMSAGMRERAMRNNEKSDRLSLEAASQDFRVSGKPAKVAPSFVRVSKHV